MRRLVTNKLRMTTVLIAMVVAVTTVFLVVQGSVQKAESEDKLTEPTGEKPTYDGPEGKKFETGEIIVKIEDEASPSDLKDLNRENDARIEEDLPKSDVNLVGLPKDLSVKDAVDEYEKSPDVEYAQPNYLLYPTKTANDTYYDRYLYALNNTGQNINGSAGTADADIDAPEAWDSTTGSQRTVVAVIDTGVDVTHPDLADNIWRNPGETPGNNVDDDGNGYVDDINGWDFLNDDASVYDPDPVSGRGDEHGTHVAGTIAAQGNNSTGVSGVNWNARIMSLKFLGKNGGSTIDAVEAINYALDKGVKISNNSWGGGGRNQALYDAIKRADSAGHLFVAAAGNDGTDNDTTARYPTNYDLPNVISVAATNNKDRLASFSNFGTKEVDLAAPGVDIVSTYTGDRYGYMSGTSMAAPHVTGVAALIKSQDPSLDDAQIRSRILGSVDKKDGLRNKTATGGRLNAASALGIRSTDLGLNTGAGATTFGRGIKLSGKLSAEGESLGDRTVTLQRRVVGSSRFSKLEQATTAQDGTYSFSGLRPNKNTYYRTVFSGNRADKLRSSVSTTRRVLVKVRVGLYTPSTKLKLGRARTVSGSVVPKHGGAVTVTIKRNGRVIARKKAALNSNSRYSFRYKPARPGTYAFFATYPRHKDNLGNRSRVKSFRVAR
ncbi:MAG: S8 family peptidase [Rubrobacteraceae bacterium]